MDTESLKEFGGLVVECVKEYFSLWSLMIKLLRGKSNGGKNGH